LLVVVVFGVFAWRRSAPSRFEEIELESPHSSQIEQNINPYEIQKTGEEVSSEKQLHASFEYRTDNMGIPEIPGKDITIIQLIGDGHFGEVFLGNWQSTSVALKKLKDPTLRNEFFAEAKLLGSLNHPNIVRLLGLHTSDNSESYMVFEFAIYGDLYSFLQTERNISEHKMQRFIREIAAGMRYLSTHNIIHRDLASRNILLGSKRRAQISDFGMSRETSDYYTTGKSNPIPFRWSPPEVLLSRKYTVQSDVWSFGIVMWEIYSRGELPYGVLQGQDCIHAITEGKLLPKPRNCPDDVYNLMRSCWKMTASERPSFDYIFEVISKIMKHKNPSKNKVQLPEMATSEFHIYVDK